MSQWEMVWPAILIIIGGLGCVALFYIPAGLEWHRKKDDYAVGVTILAAAATMFPILGLAAMSYSIRQEVAFMQEMAAIQAGADRDADALVARLEAEADARDSDRHPDGRKPEGVPVSKAN